MDDLYNKLKEYNIKKIMEIELLDRQFIALNKLKILKWEKGEDIFLLFIIINSLICYQLSSKWEDYWEEFSIELIKNFQKIKNEDDIYDFFKDFLPNSKWNKRFINIKMKRVKKILLIYNDFLANYNYYINNIEILRNTIAKAMNQKKEAKTIVFSIKMTLYRLRIISNKFVKAPTTINIPIDSRLTKIFEIHKWEYVDIKLFYSDLSKKLEIPEINLDSLLWMNYKDIIKWV